LFEQLMFQGSESLGPLDHSFYVQAVGGAFGGSTFMDYTRYFSVVPAAALERALFLEADRMRAPWLMERSLRHQVAVVKAKVSRTVLDRAYGGFPWMLLPSLLYPMFPHNDSGPFTDLDEASLDDCAAFFDTYYAPSNAVLAVVGDFTVEQARDLVEKHFDDVPARPVPQRPTFVDQSPGEVRGEHYDARAPLPGLAIGYQLPDPVSELDSYLAHILLAAMLSDGENARLQRAVHDDASILDLNAVCGNLAPFGARQPDMFTISLTHLFAPDHERLLGRIGEEVEAVAHHPPDDDEMRRMIGRWTADHYGQRDVLANRACALGKFELLYNNAGMLDQLVGRMRRVTGEDVAAAAARLQSNRRAVLVLRASGDTP
jgi:predicted Zn-dependent peptidase